MFDHLLPGALRLLYFFLFLVLLFLLLFIVVNFIYCCWFLLFPLMKLFFVLFLFIIIIFLLHWVINSVWQLGQSLLLLLSLLWAWLSPICKLLELVCSSLPFFPSLWSRFVVSSLFLEWAPSFTKSSPLAVKKINKNNNKINKIKSK